MVLIQEMALKVDQGFLGAITALFTPTADPEAERKWVIIFTWGESYKIKLNQPLFELIVVEKNLKYKFLINFFQTELIQKESDALNTELVETSVTDTSILSFFEHFHISPIKVCHNSLRI